MVRSLAISLALLFPLAWGNPTIAKAETAPSPRLYELMINGESFLVEADQQARLESKERPGVTYNVALRVALRQPIELNTLRLEYDWPAQVEDDRGRKQRTVKVHHELGYTVLFTDLGQPLEGKDAGEALDILIQSVTKSLTESGMQRLAPSKPYHREFAGAKARGVTIHYQDKEGFGQACLVYLLVGDRFTGSCIAQYFDKDEETVLPRIKALLDSVRSRR
ncbi:MAG: hypothetical protein ABFD16_21435 [Thermoguttaceae bacterium]|jgi:hypothetical protein